MSLQGIKNKKRCPHQDVSEFIYTQGLPPYVYCLSCGSIGLRNEYDEDSFDFVIKPTSQEKKVELDPIAFPKRVIRALQVKDNKTKRKASPWFIKKRKKIIAYLQKLSLQLKYSDLTFYKVLYILDKFLRAEDEMTISSDTSLSYIVLGFFLVCGKFYETDIFEPELTQFYSMNDKKKLNAETIMEHEIIALQTINYNFQFLTAYDWIISFMSSGFVLQKELITTSSSTINDIYSSLKKSLAKITSKSIFYNYSPLELALGLIELTRNKYSLNNAYFGKILSTFGLSSNFYSDCFKDLCDEITKNDQAKKENNNVETPRNTNPIRGNFSTTLSPNISNTEKTKRRFQIDCTNTMSTVETESRNEVKKTEESNVKKYHTSRTLNQITILSRPTPKNKNSYVNVVENAPDERVKRKNCSSFVNNEKYLLKNRAKASSSNFTESNVSKSTFCKNFKVVNPKRKSTKKSKIRLPSIKTSVTLC